MAEFHFYGSQEDCLAVLARILSDGKCWLVASTNYPEKKANVFTTVSPDLLHALSINRRLYIGGDFSTAPMSFSEITGGDYPGTYVVDQSRGGPLLSVSMPMCKKLDGKIWHLGPGDLYRPQYYWDDATCERVAPTEAVKKAYLHLKKQINPILKTIRLNGPIRIGEGGLSLLEQREAIILRRGKWLTVSGEFVKSNLRRDW